MSPRQLPIVSGARVVRALRRLGFDHVATRGDHVKLRKQDRTVIVPQHRELKRGTLVSILAQAGISAAELRELL